MDEQLITPNGVTLNVSKQQEKGFLHNYSGS
jgi:hypothetical protein